MTKIDIGMSGGLIQRIAAANAIQFKKSKEFSNKYPIGTWY